MDNPDVRWEQRFQNKYFPLLNALLISFKPKLGEE